MAESQYDLIFAIMGEAKHFVKAATITRKEQKKVREEIVKLEKAGVKTTRQFMAQARALEFLKKAHQNDAIAVAQLEVAQKRLESEMVKALGLEKQVSLREQLRAVGVQTTAQIEEEIAVLERLRIAAGEDGLAIAQLTEKQARLEEQLRAVNTEGAKSTRLNNEGVMAWDNIGQAVESASMGSFRGASQQIEILARRMTKMNRLMPKGASMVKLMASAFMSPAGLIIGVTAAIVLLPKLIKWIKGTGKEAKQTAKEVAEMTSSIITVAGLAIEFQALSIENAKIVQEELASEAKGYEDIEAELVSLMFLEKMRSVQSGRAFVLEDEAGKEVLDFLKGRNLSLEEAVALQKRLRTEAEGSAENLQDQIRSQELLDRLKKRFQEMNLKEVAANKNKLTALEEQEEKVKNILAELMLLESSDLSRFIFLELQAEELEGQLRTLKAIERLYQTGKLGAANAARDALLTTGRGTLTNVIGLGVRGTQGLGGRMSPEARAAMAEARAERDAIQLQRDIFGETGGAAGAPMLHGGSEAEQDARLDEAERLQAQLDDQLDRWMSYSESLSDIRMGMASDHSLMLQEMGISQGEWLFSTVAGLDMLGDIAGATFGGMANLFKELAGKNEKVNKGMFAAYKAVALAQAISDTWVAANRALASAPPPFNYVLMAGVIATGLANVARIRSMQPGSSSTGGGVGGGVGGSFGNRNYSDFSRENGGGFVPSQPRDPQSSRYMTAPNEIAAVLAVNAYRDRAPKSRSVRLDTRRADLYLDLQTEEFTRSVRGA